MNWARIPALELQRVHGDLLAGRPTDAAAAPPAAPVPRQLPADVPAFVGRPAELAALSGVDDSPALAIAVIDGMAGVGKTALAVHCAHRLALRYPDGQIFVDLHGFTDGVGPVQPGDALDRILRALGVPSEQIPGDLDERAALYRSHLAGRRVLILLDNAAADTQVAPLLPGTSGCLVLITSRRRLAGLDQTHSISLDVLPPSDAVTLFARTLGGRRLSDEYLAHRDCRTLRTAPTGDPDRCRPAAHPARMDRGRSGRPAARPPAPAGGAGGRTAQHDRRAEPVLPATHHRATGRLPAAGPAPRRRRRHPCRCRFDAQHRRTDAAAPRPPA